MQPLLAALRAAEDGKEKELEAVTNLSAAKAIRICCFCLSDLDGISTLIKKRKQPRQLWLFLVGNIFFVLLLIDFGKCLVKVPMCDIYRDFILLYKAAKNK